MDKDIFEKRMRSFEDDNDLRALQGVWIVARLDGRSFSKLTKKMNCKKPFDDDFQVAMSSIIKEIMTTSGIKIIYGYTESDEISLLFPRDTDSFNRRINKLQSILPSIASSVFTNQTGLLCSFDCRLSLLALDEYVVDYFRWRQNDSHRNALNGYCYWKLRESMNSKAATRFLDNLPKDKKHNLLMDNGINYNDVTTWHKRGTGLYFKEIDKEGFNPLKGEKVLSKRKIIYENKNLPLGEEYSDFIKNLMI